MKNAKKRIWTRKSASIQPRTSLGSAIEDPYVGVIDDFLSDAEASQIEALALEEMPAEVPALAATRAEMRIAKRGHADRKLVSEKLRRSGWLGRFGRASLSAAEFCEILVKFRRKKKGRTFHENLAKIDQNIVKFTNIL